MFTVEVLFYGFFLNLKEKFLVIFFCNILRESPSRDLFRPKNFILCHKTSFKDFIDTILQKKTFNSSNISKNQH